MSLLQELSAAKRQREDGRCGACRVIEKLDLIGRSEEAEAFREALAGTIGQEKLSQIMRRNGYPEATRHWIARHRTEGHTQ